MLVIVPLGVSFLEVNDSDLPSLFYDDLSEQTTEASGDEEGEKEEEEEEGGGENLIKKTGTREKKKKKNDDDDDIREGILFLIKISVYANVSGFHHGQLVERKRQKKKRRRRRNEPSVAHAVDEHHRLSFRLALARAKKR